MFVERPSLPYINCHRIRMHWRLVAATATNSASYFLRCPFLPVFGAMTSEKSSNSESCRSKGTGSPMQPDRQVWALGLYAWFPELSAAFSALLCSARISRHICHTQSLGDD